MLNHLIGRLSAPARAPTRRQTVGVISGRSATSRPPLSVKANSWASISSPDFARYSSSGSSTGRVVFRKSERQRGLAPDAEQVVAPRAILGIEFAEAR